MKSTIFIPKNLHVGFQNRSGTYTGKLAYIIYEDEKGVLRKETSWNSWRDDKIEPIVINNEPIEGFVLNKKVGGYSTGWNHRSTYCRVYHPIHDFEFEITVENLLYILENCSMIKGKGIEGKLVLGWDGKDLLLIPVESPDYKEISEYTNKLNTAKDKNITNKTLQVNKIYITKNKDRYLYLGKFDYYENGLRKGLEHYFLLGGSIKTFKTISGKFIDFEDNNEFDYAQVMDYVESIEKYSPVDTSKDVYTRVNVVELLKSKDNRKNYEFFTNDKRELNVSYYSHRDEFYIYHSTYVPNSWGNMRWTSINVFGKREFKSEEASKLEIYERTQYLKNGKMKTKEWRYNAK